MIQTPAPHPPIGAGAFLLALILAFPLPSAALKAFPTAEGFGSDTVGGRSGRVIHVTNLNDSGPGSFREAMLARGSRIVVFDVSGTIDLESNITLDTLDQSFLTVAGQTSPGGIQTRGPYGLWIAYGVHDVILRYLRVRPGGPSVGEDTGAAIGTYSPIALNTYNVVVDHCSMEWGNDNMIDVALNVTDVTYQWNIIAEGRNNRATNDIAYGSAILSYGLNSSYHHNLIAHEVGRTPLISHSQAADFRNNLIYNWLGNNSANWGGYFYNKSAFGNNVNNHYIAGPNSSLPYFWVENGGPIRLDGSEADRGGTKIYTEGNWGPNCPSGCADDWDNGFIVSDYYVAGRPERPLASASQFRSVVPFTVAPVATDPTSEVKGRVLPGVGASRPFRDEVDTRIVNDVLNGTGDANNVGLGGPWPDLHGTAPLDSDRDGMPDSWEDAHGLKRNDGSDGSITASNGYTNVENYLNELAGDFSSGEPLPTEPPTLDTEAPRVSISSPSDGSVVPRRSNVD